MASEQLLCPECGEPAQRKPPRSNVPYAAHGMATPEFSHLDGEPLCPVVGDAGYQPADPVDADGNPAGGVR